VGNELENETEEKSFAMNASMFLPQKIGILEKDFLDWNFEIRERSF
jgi:hypothetical protein